MIFCNYLTWTRLSVGQYDGHGDRVSVDGSGWIMPGTTRVFVRINPFKIFTKGKNETSTLEKNLFALRELALQLIVFLQLSKILSNLFSSLFFPDLFCLFVSFIFQNLFLFSA